MIWNDKVTLATANEGYTAEARAPGITSELEFEFELLRGDLKICGESKGSKAARSRILAVDYDLFSLVIVLVESPRSPLGASVSALYRNA